MYIKTTEEKTKLSNHRHRGLSLLFSFVAFKFVTFKFVTIEDQP
jgi:hypothetical protein